jgi:signal transduction histidine kinase
MLNTVAKPDSNPSLNIIDDHFLSIITSLFVEGMAVDQSERQGGDTPLSHRVPDSKKVPKSVSVPLYFASSAKTAEIREFCSRKEEPWNSRRNARKQYPYTTIRTFILGLSDAFNNLLMGMWGNLSLINMTIDGAHPICERVAEVEQLIQNGSALINGVFGYLGERRIVAKKIRLNFLLQEINQCIPIDGQRVKRDIIQASRESLSRVNFAALIAGSLASMLSQLTNHIQRRCVEISNQKHITKGIRNRLQTIDRLLKRAWQIIYQLDVYAGRHALKQEKLHLKLLVKKQAERFNKIHPALNVSFAAAQRLPSIRADRSMLTYVFDQILENAANAMPSGGDLNIDIRALNSEFPQNRCVAYRWVDSIVVTISDCGHGMDLNTLLHIFDPFFTGRRNSNRLGMGLAAAWGIIKAHGGYIHVRSEVGHGSTFKIYLPIH